MIQNALTNIRAIHERLKSVEIDHLDFRRCIKNRDAPSTLLFIDPPYLDTESYRVGAFTLQDHCDLATILANSKSKWLMTVGAHPDLRKLYKRYAQTVITTSMSVEKVIGGKRRPLTHLLIRNYEPPKTPLYAPVAGEISLLDLFGNWQGNE